MKLRRWICFLLCLVLTVCLCAPALADGELFFVAVNDTIPLTLSVFPTYSGGTLYVPYQVFDSQPCGVTPSYNQAKQTYVLLSRTRQMIFDLAAGTVQRRKRQRLDRERAVPQRHSLSAAHVLRLAFRPQDHNARIRRRLSDPALHRRQRGL